MVTLLNGSAEARTRSSDGCAILECGCAFTIKNDIATYAQMCGAHYAEYAERHARALSEHTTNRQTNPGQEKTP